MNFSLQWTWTCPSDLKFKTPPGCKQSLYEVETSYISPLVWYRLDERAETDEETVSWMDRQTTEGDSYIIPSNFVYWEYNFFFLTLS